MLDAYVPKLASITDTHCHDIDAPNLITITQSQVGSVMLNIDGLNLSSSQVGTIIAQILQTYPPPQVSSLLV